MKLTVPDSVKNHAWSMRLKYYRPADATAAKACFFSKNLNNTTDGALFIQGTDYPALGCSTGIFNPKGGRSALGYRWHEIVINADASGNTVYLDGDVAVTSFKDSSTFFNDGGILLAEQVGYCLLLGYIYRQFHHIFLEYLFTQPAACPISRRCGSQLLILHGKYIIQAFRVMFFRWQYCANRLICTQFAFCYSCRSSRFTLPSKFNYH